jgi:predicted Na+-dependent transporter
MKEGRHKKGSRQNGFIIALLCSVALAFLFPSPGARGGWMHPDLLNNAGIALILLPIMFYHPFQLFICGLLADYFSAQNPDIPVGEASPSAQSERSCG